MTKPTAINWLSGVKVLIFGNYIPAPLAGWLLRQLGADTVKIEAPKGDMMRNVPPWLKSEDGSQIGAYFMALNRDGHNLRLDFKSEEGKKDVRNLLSTADIVIDGNRPGALEKALGESVHEINPNLAYVPITAHGLTGPLKNKAGHDNNLLARAGLLSYTPLTANGNPSVFSAPVADILSAFIAALSAVAAVLGRRDGNGTGTTIDASMLHAAFFFNQLMLSGMNATGESPKPGVEWMNGGMPNYRPYLTQDGYHVFLGPIEPHLFQHFCVAIEKPNLASMMFSDPWSCIQEVQDALAEKTLAEWQEVLANVDCCFNVVNTLEEALQDPQIQALGLVEEVEDERFGKLQFVAYPAGITSAPH